MAPYRHITTPRWRNIDVLFLTCSGTVEIVNDVPLIKKGDKVGASEATLLNMLGISPFAYALIVQYVYDNGSLYEPHILDIKVRCRCRLCPPAHAFIAYMPDTILGNPSSMSLYQRLRAELYIPTSVFFCISLCICKQTAGVSDTVLMSFLHMLQDSDLLARFMSGITNVAAVSLAIGYPTLAAVPHMLVNGYKNVLAVALATDITFKQAEKAKAFLAVCVCVIAYGHDYM